MAAQHACSPDDIRNCPSARSIKALLNPLDQWLAERRRGNPRANESYTVHIINTMLKIRGYSVTKLLDDVHHLKYEHEVDENDNRFDIAYDFFKGTTSNNGCDIDQCPLFERHHRDRGRQRIGHKMEDKDDLLMDTLSMIHCYFVHSYETQRFTKAERYRIMRITGSKTWDSAQTILEDDSVESVSTALMNQITPIVRSKRNVGRRRFRDEDQINDDFAAMSLSVGVDEQVLRAGLRRYGQNRNRLISDLIDVVYGEKAEYTAIWQRLRIKITSDQKRIVFSDILYKHFECTQLNTQNLLKLFGFIIGRKRLQIDVGRLRAVVIRDHIDGKMFDKTDPEHHVNMGNFAKRFKVPPDSKDNAVPECKAQHLRQLYGAVNKWQYVKVKQVVKESNEKKENDGDNEKDDVKEDDEEANSGQPDVYAIGKRFLFWKSQRRKKEYVEAKYSDMKEEVLHEESALSRYFTGIKGWNKLSSDVNTLVKTQAALKINSNGRFRYIFMIRKGKPFDKEHIRALKLYTDFDKLCKAFCEILRRGDRKEIAGIANMARMLTETIQCFGSPLSAKKKYYRGVKKTFMFMTIVSRFNLPQSTTTNVK